jgi:aminomethyltransferase
MFAGGDLVSDTSVMAVDSMRQRIRVVVVRVASRLVTTGQDAPIDGPLTDRHLALGARMAEFGGWRMPLSYAGVIEEHQATRSAVGIFDVSHLGKARVTGEGAHDLVNAAFTNDLDRLVAGQAQYTLCCDDETGGVVDDLIAYRGDDDVFLIPNAANSAEVVDRLRAAAPAGVDVVDEHQHWATIAVQGPHSAEVMAAVGLPHDLDYLAFRAVQWQGTPVIVCRTGYTGEHGYELLPRAESAGALWDAVLAAALPLGGQPCGLGARDTLRTEMGYPLHGQDLSIAVTPNQARLGWAVGWRKPRFWGKAVLEREREIGVPRLLWGLRAEDRGIPRPHMPVRLPDDVDIGETTSGTFSPTLRAGIGLALLSRGVGEGDEVCVDVRGKPATMRVVKPPFVEAHTR